MVHLVQLLGRSQWARRAEASHRSSASLRQMARRAEASHQSLASLDRWLVGPKLRTAAQLRSTDGSGCDASALHALCACQARRAEASHRSSASLDRWLRVRCFGLTRAVRMSGPSGRSFAPQLSFARQMAPGAMLRPYTRCAHVRLVGPKLRIRAWPRSTDGSGCDASALHALCACQARRAEASHRSSASLDRWLRVRCFGLTWMAWDLL